MIVEHVYTFNWEYIVERESIQLVAQPCKKYLSWEDGETYMYVLDHQVLITWMVIDTLTYKNGREMFLWRQVMIMT